MASRCFDKLQEGEDINGKGYVLKFIKLKEMPNGKARVCMSDADGKEMGNLIIKQDTFNENKMKAGDMVEIVKANKLSLRNGKPAYVIQRWNIKPAEVKPKTPNPTTFGSTSAAPRASQPNSNATKLSAISPYTNNWEAEVRILKKEQIREWNNQRGSGRLQKYLIADESGKMQMTLWKDDIDRFAHCEIDKVYRLSGAQVKPADKKWNRTGMDYELSSTQQTRFEEAVGVVIQSNYDFVKLNDLASKEVESNVDVVGIVHTVEEPAEFQSKHSEKMYYRRNFQLVDETGTSVRVTLWGKPAEEFTATKGCAIEVSGATIREWQNAKNLNFTNDTIFKVKDEMDENPLAETQALFDWWNTSGKDQQFAGVGGGSGGGNNQVRYADIKSVEHIQTLGNGEQADYADIHGWISFFARRESNHYKADPDTRKKAIESGDGTFMTADGKVVEKPENRLLLGGIKLTDTSDELWANAFHDECLALLQLESADDLVNATNNGDHDPVFNKALFTEFIFRMKIKEEYYQDTPRKRFTIVRCAPVDYEQYNEYLLQELEA